MKLITRLTASTVLAAADSDMLEDGLCLILLLQ